MNIYFISCPKVCFFDVCKEIFQSTEQVFEHKHSSIIFSFIIIIHTKRVFENLLYP